MLVTNNVSLTFGGQKLFEDVNIKFTPGNCYGLIGANGSGKSTFIKLLSGEIEMQKGSITKGPGERMSVLKQDQFAYNEYTVLETVLKGNEALFKIMQEKDAIYAKPDFSDADGMKAAELEGEFAEMNGWEAEPEAQILLAGLGLDISYSDRKMKELRDSEKIKVLLAQAIFGNPDILLLDEPTNHLDIKRKTGWSNSCSALQIRLSLFPTIDTFSIRSAPGLQILIMEKSLSMLAITTFGANRVSLLKV